MFIQKIKLENFRNFKSLELDFDPNPGIFIMLGENAQGKTNILESISLLAFPRSQRAKTPTELVNFGQNYYTIEAEFQKSQLKIGYQIRPSKRTYQLNQVPIPLKEYLTNFQTVMFTPEDIEIIAGAPHLRRRLVDTILSQTDREYFEDLIEYTKILKQRNALLKRIKQNKAKSEELNFWNKKLVNLIELITQKRRSFFEFLTEHLPETYKQLADDNSEKIQIDYSYTAKSRQEHFDSYRDAIIDNLEAERNREIDAGHTVVGPHRDDFSLKLNDKPVSQFCSRGEKRSFMLALKLAEIKYLHEVTRQKPVLLLDDVFSELDKNRRHKLLELTEGYQTFISTVEKSYFDDYNGQIHLFKVHKNEIIAYN